MIIKKKTLVLILVIHVFFLAGSLALTTTFNFQETDLVKLRANTLDIDNDKVEVTYSPPLNRTGEWQTGYDDAGSYNIKIVASDGVDSTTETITLIVEEKNRVPALDHPALIVKEGETVSLDFPNRDLDGNLLTYTFDPPLSETGQWTTTYQDEGSYKFEVTVSDGKLENSTIVEITVLDIDQDPVLNLPDKIDVYENELLELNIDAYDPDGNEISINVTNLPEGASLDAENKVMKWKPSFGFVKRKGGVMSTVLNALRLENKFLRKKELDQLNIIVCSEGLCIEDSVRITVHNVNQKPTLELPSSVTLMETEEIKINVIANDPDGDLVQYHFSEPFNKWKGVWKTKYGEQGEYTVYVTATDGELEQVVPINVTVLPLNRRPQIKIKNDEITVNEGELVEFSVSASDPEDNVTVNVVNAPPGSSFEDGVFSWIPAHSTVTNRSKRWEDNLVSGVSFINKFLSKESNIRWMEFVVSDGEFEVIHPVKLTVKNVNLKPEIVDFLPSSAITAKINEPVVFHIAAKDNDQDKLDYEWSFSFHESRVKGTDTIERTFVTPGKKKVRVTVNDGRQEFAKEWIVQVLEERAKPSFDPENFKVYVIEG